MRITSPHYKGIVFIAVILLFASCGLREDIFQLASERPLEGSFELVDVYSTSNTSVRVVFSHYVDEASGGSEGCYSIPGLTIFSAKVDSSERTSVDVTTFPQQQIEYGLTVSGVVDVDGYILENQTSMTFHGDVAPLILSASSFDNTTVAVYFSEEVEQVSAETASNYSIMPGLGVVSAARDEADWSKVTLVTDPQSGAVTYTLTVNGVVDLTGNPVGSPNSKDFVGTDPLDMTPPDVLSAVLVDSNTVEVQFSEPVELVSSEDVLNYLIEDGVGVPETVSMAVRQADASKVRLDIGGVFSKNVYYVEVNTVVTDLALNPMLGPPENRESFAGVGTSISFVQATSNTGVRVFFTNDVALPDAEVLVNYSISGLTVLGALRDGADYSLVDLTTSPQADVNYTLSVSGVISPDSASFDGDVSPYILSAISMDYIEVVVYFSEEVEQTSAEKVPNYNIAPGLGVVGAVRDGADWSKVTLVTDPQSEAVTYTLTVNGVVDLTGNPVRGPNSIDFTGPDPEEIIQPENWGSVQDYLNDQASMGVTGPPTADSNAIPTSSNLGKWYGGVLAPNGKIYGIPWNSTSVLIVDPVTNTSDETTITGLPATADKWLGGVLAPNNKIYCIPWQSDNVLIIDPELNTYDDTTISGLAGSAKWHSGVLAPNGKIYAIPCDSTSVLIIDPVTNTIDDTTISVPSGAGKWYGGVLAPNGKIYAIPWNYDHVLIIDPETNTVDYSTISVPTSGTKWVGGVLAPNGKIYCIPRNYDHVLIIDPATNTADYTTISVPGDTDKWNGGVLTPDGKIYGIPRDYDYVLIIDPDTNTADFSTLGVVPGTGKWVGGVLAPNGRIYCIPRDYDHVLVIDPKSNGTFGATVSLSGYFNKF
jgi:hypothetical protein